MKKLAALAFTGACLTLQAYSQMHFVGQPTLFERGSTQTLDGTQRRQW